MPEIGDCPQGKEIQGNLEVVAERLANYIAFSEKTITRIEHAIELCTKETKDGLKEIKKQIEERNKYNRVLWVTIIGTATGIIVTNIFFLMVK
ncbi:MAG: hypothetical protein ACE5HR_00055 [bacterium]